MDADHNKHDLEAKRRIILDIDKYGWHVGFLESEDHLPSFVITIGAYKTYSFPELIMIGMKTDFMHIVVNNIIEAMKNGLKIETGTDYNNFLKDYPIQFLKVDESNYYDYMGYCNWFNNGIDYPCFQVIWPDVNSRFPWDKDFTRKWIGFQPMLDRNQDFKFLEAKDLCVFTTTSVMSGKEILRVHHNRDGDWQFHHEEYPELADARVVCLSDIVKLDSTLNGIYDLQLGYCATRESKNVEWIITIDEEE